MELNFLEYLVVLILVALICGGLLLTGFLIADYITFLFKNKKNKNRSFWDFGKK